MLAKQSNSRKLVDSTSQAVSMHNLNEFIASSLYNILAEPSHVSDILSHCAPMPQLKLLEVLSTPFSFKGQSNVSFGDNFYGQGSLESLFDGLT